VQGGDWELCTHWRGGAETPLGALGRRPLPEAASLMHSVRYQKRFREYQNVKISFLSPDSFSLTFKKYVYGPSGGGDDHPIKSSGGYDHPPPGMDPPLARRAMVISGGSCPGGRG